MHKKSPERSDASDEPEKKLQSGDELFSQPWKRQSGGSDGAVPAAVAQSRSPQSA